MKIEQLTLPPVTWGYIETLKNFISDSQLATLAENTKGEEGQYFTEALRSMSDLVSSMPETYEQDGKGDQAVVYLHYFNSSMDWHITEKDSDPDGRGQIQAFGLANLGHGAELGYISIQELILHDVEIDLHFTPKTLKEVKEAQ